MTENININPEIPVEEVVEKPKKGRPNTTGIVYDKNNVNAYHADYYHLKRTVDVICECGALIKAGHLLKHKKRAIHTRRMKKIDPA